MLYKYLITLSETVARPLNITLDLPALKNFYCNCYVMLLYSLANTMLIRICTSHLIMYCLLKLAVPFQFYSRVSNWLDMKLRSNSQDLGVPLCLARYRLRVDPCHGCVLYPEHPQSTKGVLYGHLYIQRIR